jgi:hypothetical protein
MFYFLKFFFVYNLKRNHLSFIFLTTRFHHYIFLFILLAHYFKLKKVFYSEDVVFYLILIIEIKNQSHDDLGAVMRITSSSTAITFLIIIFKLVQILVFSSSYLNVSISIKYVCVYERVWM